MAVAARVALPKSVGLGAGVVPLLALAIFINYVDRGNLATAAPLIKDQLKLSASEIGLLLSAFSWTYTPSQILAGWLSERINAYRTLALGLFIWSVATALSGLASSFWMLIGLRLLLGIGESAAFPCSSKLIAQHLPQNRMGAANGLIGVGLALGPAFGTFFGGKLMAISGWRPLFIGFGLVSLLWLVPWLLATRGASAAPEPEDHGEAPSYWAILAKKEAWGAGLGHFCNNYAFYFVISWLPLYLVKSRGFSIGQMAEIGGMIYLVYAASCLVVGRVTDFLLQQGIDSSLVRKGACIASHAIVAASLAVCAIGSSQVSIISLFVAGVAFGLNTSTMYAVGQTLGGARGGGKWIGLQNCMGNVAGIVGPIITGVIVDRTGQFYWAFIVAAVISLIGIAGWTLLIRRIELLDWTTKPA
jgi:MFS family permease